MLSDKLWPWALLAALLATAVVLAVALTAGTSKAAARRAARRDVRYAHRAAALLGGSGAPPDFRLVDGLEVAGDMGLGYGYRGGTATRDGLKSAVMLRTEPALSVRGATTVSGPGLPRISPSGDVYHTNGNNAVVGGKRVRAAHVQLLDGELTIIDGRCSAGGRLRGTRTTVMTPVVRAGPYVAYADGESRVLVDRLTREAGLVAAGAVLLPAGRTLADGDASGRVFAVSDDGLRLAVATSSSTVLSYARAAAAEEFRLTGAGAPMGEGVRRLEATPSLSHAAVQVRTHVAGETALLAYAWDAQARMLGEVPQAVCAGRDQHLCELDAKKRMTVYNGGVRGGLDVWQEATAVH